MDKFLRRWILCSFFWALALVVAGGPAFAETAKRKSGPEVKNIVVLVCDGCGFNHFAAAGFYQFGKAGAWIYESFSVQSAMSTYEYEKEFPGGFVLHGYDTHAAWTGFDYVKSNFSDSASAATAMATGEKTYNGAIGVNIHKAVLGNVIEYAEKASKSTGLVTSVPFSHATPAAFAAHNVSRDNYAEIAREMIYASAVDIIMGCGAPDYDNSGEKLEKLADTRYVGGPDTWRDLVDAGSVRGADADGDGDGDDWVVIRDRVQFQGLAGGETPARVIGIPRVSTTLQQARGGDRNAEPFAVPLIPTVPTLEEMTLAALNVLDNDPDGFLLVVEGGAVDWASHANQSGRMIEEQIDFDKAVAAVVDWVRESSNWEETLVVVTADHECGYLAGPGSAPAWQPIVNNGAGHLPGMEWHSDDHTNSLVPFYAQGAAARLFESEADEMDTVRGNYLDNAEMGRVLIELLKR